MCDVKPLALLEPLLRCFHPPVDLSYPLPPGEDEEIWCRRCREAVELLADQGRLQSVDSRGIPLQDLLLSLVDLQIPESLRETPGHLRLVGELVRNIAEPGRINQGFKGTCAVTSVETWLAVFQPAEYARIIEGLMSLDGRVVLHNTDALTRDEQVLVWHAQEARRSPASRLFQVAAMEYAYPNLDYVNITDGQYEDDGHGGRKHLGTGLDLDAFDHLLEGVTGMRWDTLSDKQSHMARLLEKLGLDTSSVPDLTRDGWAIVRQSLQAGDNVFATLAPHGQEGLGPQGEGDEFLFLLPHKVRVMEYDAASDRVVYEDPLDPEEPWIPGAETRLENLQGRCSMPRADFLRLMVEVSYRPQHWQAVKNNAP